jgi:hypothetical protein
MSSRAVYAAETRRRRPNTEYHVQQSQLAESASLSKDILTPLRYVDSLKCTIHWGGEKSRTQEAQQHRLPHQVDTIALEEGGGVLADFPVISGEDKIHELDDTDTDVVDKSGIQFPHVLRDHVIELCRHLDACRASANNDKGEELSAFL